MTRHEDVYYTCNSCGNKLAGLTNGEEQVRTVVTVTNTDLAATEPTHEYDLCAKCWLDIYPLLNKVEISRARAQARKDREEREDHDRFVYHHPGFEG